MSFMHAISTTREGKCTTFRVVGDLSGNSVVQLAKSWHKIACDPRQTFRVDLCAARRIDDEGKHLLCEMFGNGIELIVPVRNRARRILLCM